MPTLSLHSHFWSSRSEVGGPSTGTGFQSVLTAHRNVSRFYTESGLVFQGTALVTEILPLLMETGDAILMETGDQILIGETDTIRVRRLTAHKQKTKPFHIVDLVKQVST